MEVKLIVQNGKQAGRVIPVAAPRFLIGRSEECQLRVQSNLISRQHTLIVVEADSVTVEDCGSTNHTFVNDEMVTERRELHNGDRLRVGLLGFNVELVSPVVEGKRRPKVHSVQEAAARTAAAPPASSEDDFDISGWLAEDAQEDERASEVTRETIADMGKVDTAPIRLTPVEPTIAKEPPPKPHTPAKGAGKFQVPKRIAESSGAAADDALRQLFHRRKP